MSLKDLTSVRDSTNQLVQSVQCYNVKPLILQGFIGPFLTLQTILCVWYFYSDENYSDIYIIAGGSLCLLQLLAFLSGIWSVHCLCFLSYSKVCLKVYFSFLELKFHFFTGKKCSRCSLGQSSAHFK